MNKRLLFLLTFLPFLSLGQSFDLIKTFLGHTTGVETVTFSPDGNNIISGDLDGNIFFWDLQTGNIVKILKAHKSTINQISFSADGKTMCTSSDDGTVKLWDLLKVELKKTIINPNSNAVSTGVISPNNNYVYFGVQTPVIGGKGAVFKKNLNTDAKPELVYYAGNGVADGLISNDFTHFIFSSANSIKYLDFRNDKIDLEIGTCEDYVNNLALSPMDSNIIVSWCQDGTMNFWNINKNMNISSIKAGDGEEYSRLSFSSDGKYLLSGNSKTNARVWDPITKNLLAELKGHTDVVRDAKFSHDNKFIVTSSYDGTLKLWKVPINETIQIKKEDNPIKPEVHFEKNNIPVTVSDRPVSKQEDVKLKSQDIEFFVWDNVEEDGDTISLNINGTWVLENYEVTHIKKSIKYTLQPNTNNYLILYAHNLGKHPPNTAAVSIYDGSEEKILTLKSDLKSCGAINFIYKPKK